MTGILLTDGHETRNSGESDAAAAHTVPTIGQITRFQQICEEKSPEFFVTASSGRICRSINAITVIDVCRSIAVASLDQRRSTSRSNSGRITRFPINPPIMATLTRMPK